MNFICVKIRENNLDIHTLVMGVREYTRSILFQWILLSNLFFERQDIILK